MVLGGVTLAGMIGAILRGDRYVAYVVGASLVLSGGLIWYGKYKVSSLLRSPTSEPAVRYYRKKMSGLPHGNAFIAYMSALVLTFYGDFDQARDELSKVSWSGLPPMYEGFQVHVLAVLAVLQERNYVKASELAVESRDLCSVSKAFPGNTQSRRALDALVDACELLAGRAGDETVARLDEAIKKLPHLAVLIPAWTLARHYRFLGDEGRAASYAAIVQKFAPHCGPLNETSFASKATSR